MYGEVIFQQIDIEDGWAFYDKYFGWECVFIDFFNDQNLKSPSTPPKKNYEWSLIILLYLNGHTYSLSIKGITQ